MNSPVRQHLVRYGTPADQKYLVEEFLDTYDQIVLNAKMLAHAPAALATFLTHRAKKKPFFVDPQTHAFQHGYEYLESQSDSSYGNLKNSFRKLIEAYGSPVKEKIEKKIEA